MKITLLSIAMSALSDVSHAPPSGGESKHGHKPPLYPAKKVHDKGRQPRQQKESMQHFQAQILETARIPGEKASEACIRTNVRPACICFEQFSFVKAAA